MKHLDLTGLAHESKAAWEGVLDLAAVCAEGWSLAGGQAVFVQTALRGRVPDRPSTDADLVIDLRADPGAARRLTEALREIGFEPTRRDGDGRKHRWIRGEAQVDVLQPRYLGERVEKRLNEQGLETIGAPGAQHLLSRTMEDGEWPCRVYVEGSHADGAGRWLSEKGTERRCRRLAHRRTPREAPSGACFVSPARPRARS